MKKSFQGEIKALFTIFKRLSLKQIKQLFGKSLTLTTLEKFKLISSI